MTELGAHGTLSARTSNVPWSSRDRLLRSAAVLYAAGLALHTADHIRRGSDVLTSSVRATGAVSTIAGVVAIVLVLSRHRRAPLVAAIVGFQAALGIVRVHLLPYSSSFSDAFPGARGTDVTAFSWTAVTVEMVGALLLGIVAANLLFHQRGTGRRERRAASSRGDRRDAEGAE